MAGRLPRNHTIQDGRGVTIVNVNLEQELDSLIKIDEYFKKVKRRTVILFADLADSTRYKQMRRFAMGLMRTRHHNEIVAKWITKNSGEVVKYMGDGVLARWDYESGHGAMHRPLNAAIRIQEELQKVNEEITDPLERIESKIGLALGVVADFYGRDPQGQVVDLAARIQANAKPGQILVHQDLVDEVDQSKIVRQSAPTTGPTAIPPFGPAQTLTFRGIREPQKIVELRWSDALQGIKMEGQYDEFWENCHYTATILPLTDVAEEIKQKYFRIAFELKYRTVLRQPPYSFVCVDTIADLNDAMHDRSQFSRYMLPKSGSIQDRISELHQIEFFTINGKKLVESHHGAATGNHYYSRTWDAPNLANLVGKQVTIHYRLNTIIAKRGNFFCIVTEFPVREFLMSFDMLNVGVRTVRAIDYFVASSPVRYTYLPNQKSAKKIDAWFDEWVYPRGGVVFVWDLDESERVNTAR